MGPVNCDAAAFVVYTEGCCKIKFKNSMFVTYINTYMSFFIFIDLKSIPKVKTVTPDGCIFECPGQLCNY